MYLQFELSYTLPYADYSSSLLKATYVARGGKTSALCWLDLYLHSFARQLQTCVQISFRLYFINFPATWTFWPWELHCFTFIPFDYFWIFLAVNVWSCFKLTRKSWIVLKNVQLHVCLYTLLIFVSAGTKMTFPFSLMHSCMQYFSVQRFITFSTCNFTPL